MHICTHVYHIHTLLAPSTKKQKREIKEQKREEKSKAEKAMKSTMNAFIKYQLKADKIDKECWKKEAELEEKRRREDQQHELCVMQMLGQMLQQQRSYPPLVTLRL